MDLKFNILLFYYNRPELVKNAIDSINKLHYDNFFVSFIDDGSDVNIFNICKQNLNNDILDKSYFYNTHNTQKEKEKMGGSIFGKYANRAISENYSDIVLMLCDDDALISDYLYNLNIYFTENINVNYCYSKVLYYNPKIEPYLQASSSKIVHPDLNMHTSPINANCKVDSSQVAWRRTCNVDNGVWFEYPLTRNLDASLYQSLYDKCGPCYPTNFYGQYKAIFDDQLGNRQNDYNVNLK